MNVAGEVVGSPFQGNRVVGKVYIHAWLVVHALSVGGCYNSVAERWQLKPEALGSTPNGTTFLTSPSLSLRSTDSNGPDCV